ncbi:hypothetical protein AVEN_188048-1 [Araneus ventricosus]|uniref:Uncharacterized protein n=1 Tax=Araneus ventricosus TaxID=182803 RepID=A0A4Y2FRL3_ARAVE|nr:hypothetical protein AVEN_188048-1 [Araneus ventricosus]
MEFTGAKTIKRAIHRLSKLEFLEHGEEKPIVKVENLRNLEQMDSKRWNLKELTIQNSTRDSNLGHRCEARRKAIVLPRLVPRVEARNYTRNLPSGGRGDGWEKFCDFEPCLKTNFGTSVNA